MSTPWHEALLEAWIELASQPAVLREYRTKLVTTSAPINIFAALRAADNAPCLLLQASIPQTQFFELGGIRLYQARGQNGLLLVLSLEDVDRRDLFVALCADLIAASVGFDAESGLSAFLARLDAWRLFLRDRRSGLSREETVGLLGELVVLDEILKRDASLLPSWRAPNDGLHDFEIAGHALEVKTRLGGSSQLRISTLDQLDASGLRALNLVHVKLVETPQGVTVSSLASSIAGRLVDDAARRQFDNALLQRGLMPDDDTARMRPAVTTRSIDVYEVNDQFPRLAREMIPPAVIEASYVLSLSAIASFATDASRTLDAFAGRLAA